MARRRGERQPNALVAAASRIDLANPRVAERQAAKRETWQAEAWAYFDEVPELKEAIRYRGNQLAKLRLFVAVENPDDPKGDPVPAENPASGVPAAVATVAAAELARLHGEYGGQGAILAELDMNHEVAGECYLVGIGEHDKTETVRGVTVTSTVPEDWQIRSISEVIAREGQYIVLDRPGEMDGTTLNPDRDTIMRLWLRHPQWSSMPDSPMRGLLGECRTLQVLSQQVLAQAMRSVSAGFFAVPNELSFGPDDPTRAESENEPDRDPLSQALNDVLVRPIDNPSDPSTVQPGILRGAGEFLKPDMLRHIKFYDPTLDTVLEDKIEARVQRIARGLNLPVEKIMGHQQTTFANAAQVDEDEFNDYLRPSADSAVDALTFAFLIPQLRDVGVPEEWTDGSLFVWYDATELISQPDKEANADAAFDRFAISYAAYRAAKGFGDDDAPDVEELLTRAGLRRGTLSNELTQALLEMLGTDIEVEAAPESPVGELPPAPEDQPVDQQDTAAARSELLKMLAEVFHVEPPAASPQPRQVIETTAVLAAAGPNYGRQL
ncbi:MAG: hypothetical protein MUP97_12615, partial [Acidimicrobiia bacterium]|nr:hypothetical protein [Acidimicrobiia bacterium]